LKPSPRQFDVGVDVRNCLPVRLTQNHPAWRTWMSEFTSAHSET
jgi:hypothetical protein